MSAIRANWRRVVQVRPYESETLELGVETDVVDVGGGVLGTLAKASAELWRALAEQGDALVLERLAAHHPQSAAALAAALATPLALRPAFVEPSEPDEFLK